MSTVKPAANSADQTDDGLPLPDSATFQALAAEAWMGAPPNRRDWAEFVAMLRWAVRFRGKNAGDCTAARIALQGVLVFLQKQDCVMRHGAGMPLIDLQSALLDLIEGRDAPMLRPPVKQRGKPRLGRYDASLMGNAARAMSLLMESGTPEDEASRIAGRALGLRPETIKNWRDRLNQGPGPGAPQDAINHYKAPLPAWPGSTSKQQGERLLQLLKERMPAGQ